MSLYTRTVTTTLATTGSAATLGVTVVDSNGAVLMSRLSLNIVESPAFTYTLQIANFDSTWYGSIIWDNSGTVVSTTPFTGTDVDAPFVNTASYVTVEQANDYFSGRLNSGAWEDAVPTDQLKALVTSTRAIERLNFVGVKAVWNQQFQWPRIVGPRRIGQASVGIIPTDIFYAVCENALSLLDGVDPALEDQLLSSQADAYATIRVTSDSKIAKDYIKAGIVSVTAWNYLLSWLQDPRAINIQKG